MRTCGWCGGSGTVPCDCEHGDDDCPMCGGSGWDTCPECGGTGVIEDDEDYDD